MHKWCHVCIKWGKCLCSCSFILERSQKVYQLIHCWLKVFGWVRFYSVGDAIESLFKYLSQTSSCAISWEHIQVMNMDIPVSMCFSYFCWINMWKPVVSCDFPWCIENHSTKWISAIRICIDSPVLFMDVFFDCFLYVNCSISAPLHRFFYKKIK
jgi:hypothetical protein